MARRHLVWRGRGGSFKLPLESIRRLNEPPRLRPAKVASRHFVVGRSHPSFAKEGNSGSFCFSSFAANCPARSGSLNLEISYLKCVLSNSSTKGLRSYADSIDRSELRTPLS